MAVDPNKAYDICRGMGGSHEQCLKQNPKSRHKKTKKKKVSENKRAETSEYKSYST